MYLGFGTVATCVLIAPDLTAHVTAAHFQYQRTSLQGTFWFLRNLPKKAEAPK